MFALAKLYLRFIWAKLLGDETKALAAIKEIIMLNFANMDSVIGQITAKIAADKTALDNANAALATAQTDLANAQAELDKRTAAISAAIA